MKGIDKKMEKFYNNYRVVFNKNEAMYDLTKVFYDLNGDPSEIVFVTHLGETLSEVQEILQGLSQDIDNWSKEELYVTLV